MEYLAQIEACSAQIPSTDLVLGGILVAVVLMGVPFLLAPPRYVREPMLFSAAEWDFFRALESAVGDQCRIFAKVRIADVITPKKTINRQAWWRAFRQISSKHVDFVLVDAGTSEILAAIELDDRSHERQERRSRDAFVDRVFAQAGIPLVRVPVRWRGRRYNIAEIRELVVPFVLV